jgi:hypothetical protein
MQADVFDQHGDVRLRAAQRQLAPGLAQPPRDHREVEHERRIGERELGQVDEHVPGRAQRLRERLAAQRLRRAILIAAAAQRRWIVLEGDDGSFNLARS